MSTRSGKRIHASIHEDVKSQRKSRRQKDNGEMDTTTISKRNNYVSYPNEDNLIETDGVDQKLPKRKRKTLNQHNQNMLEATDMNTTMVRETRSNKKINNITEVALESDRNIEVVNGKIKPKKSKKKRENKKNGKENIVTVTTQTKGKSKKKKRKQSLETKSNNMEVVESNDVHNQSDESVDSYHSANACSPRQINIPSLTPDINAKADNRSKKNTPMDVSNAFTASPSQTLNDTFDKSNSDIKNSTFDNINISKENSFRRKCKLSSTSDMIPTVSINSTYDKLDVTFDKNNKSSLDREGAVDSTYDKFNGSHISINSDQSSANIILNDTPMPNENSVNEFKKCIEENKMTDDESLMSSDFNVSEKSTSPKSKPQSTPLKREGTFTIEGENSVILSPKHEVVMRKSSPGSTPFPLNNKRVSKEKNKINLTRSIEKKAKSPRNTKVMFCSPVNNPAILSQRKSKIIKSNLKGSNKSFVFDDESMSLKNQATSNCKRLLPRSYMDRMQAKRKRLVDDQQESVQRLSKPRTPNVKSSEAIKKDANKSSTKLPNFSALHRKQFAKMESLVDCQQRKAERARQLLAPAAGLDRSTTKVPSVSSIQNGDTNASNPKPPDVKSGYTRFGFKLNTNVNPFNVTVESKPSTVGATVTTCHRRQAAKKAASREKPSKSLRISLERNENRTVIKGVRTNRRFELQMKARNLQLD